METRIRACGPADATALSLVAQATFLESYADALPGADIVDHCEHQHAAARYAEWLADPAHRLWIAETATGAPIGYVMLSPPDLPVPLEPGDLELKRIYLLSRFHGSGLGARMMATAREAAAQAGARRLLLGVYQLNARAIAFYARQGFAEAGVRKFVVGANTYDDLVLAVGL